MTSSLFGGGKSKSTSQNLSGYSALPTELQNRFRDIARMGGDIAESPSQYFAPMGLTSEEQMAGQMILPENIQSGISQYLNPFRSIISEDINKQFEVPVSALKQRATEAGAFGDSRYRSGQADIERARLDAIARASSDQYNQAANQYQQGISNLLGFGGLRRGLDLSQRQAMPSAVSYYADLINPLLSSGQGSTYNRGASDTLGQLGSFAGGIGGLMAGMGGTGAAGAAGGASSLGGLMAFSDRNLKQNIKQVGTKNGFNVYEFNYKDSPVRYKGVMAQDVQEIIPDAVTVASNGFLMVDYSKLGFSMERVA